MTSTLIISRRQRRRQRNERRRLERAAHRERKREMLEARKRLLERTNETQDERVARLARTWAPLSTNLISALRGDLQLVPFDELPRLFDPAAVATDPESMAAQLRNAIRLVHASLHENAAPRAVALARSMWDIWPEAAPNEDEDKADDDDLEEEDLVLEKNRAIQSGLDPPQVAEFLALRKIFLLDLAGEERVIDCFKMSHSIHLKYLHIF